MVIEATSLAQKRLDQHRIALAKFIMDNRHPLRILGGVISFVGMHGEVSADIVKAVDEAISLKMAQIRIASLLPRLSREWNDDVPITPLPPKTDVERERERCALVVEGFDPDGETIPQLSLLKLIADAIREG